MASVFSILDPLSAVANKSVHIQPKQSFKVCSVTAVEKRAAGVDWEKIFNNVPLQRNTLTIEGIKGCGKTSLSMALGPLLRDKNIKPAYQDDAMASLRHAEPDRWNFVCELARMESQNKEVCKREITTDESPLTSIVGVITLFKTKSIHECEYKTLADCAQHMCWLPRHIVFINCNPHTAHARAVDRSTSIDTLIKMDEAYAKLLEILKKIGVEVHVVDGSRSLEAVVASTVEIMRRLGRLS
jgi:thymidylate kinase